MSLMDVFVKIGADTSELESGVKKSEGLVGSLGKGLGTAMKVAGAAVAGATTAVAGFAAASVKAGASFDSAMSQVAATLGYTSEEIKNNVNGAGDAYNALRAKAEEAGRSTIFSASQSAEGLNILAMSGYDAEHSIAMLDDVLHLAAAGSMDMATAAGYVSGAMKGFNDDTKGAGYYADLMAKGATLANTSVSQLGDAMSSGAAGAAAYGQSAESMTVSLLRLAEQGEVGAAAGTALAAAMKNLYTPTDQAKQALVALGVDAFDPATGTARDFNDVVNDLEASMQGMTDEEKASFKQTIFGIQGLDAYNKMVVTGTEKQNDWAEALSKASEGAGEAAKQYDTMTDNLEGDIEGWKSALEGFEIAVSQGAMGSVREFVEFGTAGLSKITDAFKSGGLESAMDVFGTVLSDGLTMIIDKLPAFVDAGMQLLGALGKGLIDNLPKITDAAVNIVGQLTKGLAKALPALAEGAVQVVKGLADGLAKAAPTLIPTAIQAILDVVKALLESAPQLEQAGWNLLQGLADGILNAIPVIINMIPQLLNSFIAQMVARIPIMIDGAIQLVNGIVQALPTIIQALVDAIPQIIDGIVNGLIQALPALIKGCIQLTLALVAALPQIISALIDAVPMIIQAITQAIIGNAQMILMAVIQILAQVGSELLRKGAEFVKNVGQTMMNILNTTVQWLSQLPEKMAYWAGYAIGSFIKFIAELPSKISNIFTTVVSKVVSFGNTVTSKAREIATTFLNNMINNIKNLPANLWNIFTSVIAKASELASNLSNKAVEMARGFVNSLVSGISSLPSKFAEIGSRIVDGLWSGIKGGWDWLKDKVSDLADSLFQGAKDALGIHSPSRKFKWIGQMIDEGLASGIDKFSYLVDGSLGDLGVLDYVNTAQPQLAIAGNYGGGGDYNQTINIYSPTALTPSEVARQTRNATRDMVLELRGKR